MRRRSVVVLAVFAGVLALAVSSALAARYVLPGKVTAASLRGSVASAAESTFPSHGECVQVGASTAWDCWVVDRGGSGSGRYRVRVEDGGSCWTARRTSSAADGHGMPARLDGCVRLWHWMELSG